MTQTPSSPAGQLETSVGNDSPPSTVDHAEINSASRTSPNSEIDTATTSNTTTTATPTDSSLETSFENTEIISNSTSINKTSDIAEHVVAPSPAVTIPIPEKHQTSEKTELIPETTIDHPEQPGLATETPQKSSDTLMEENTSALIATTSDIEHAGNTTNTKELLDSEFLHVKESNVNVLGLDVTKPVTDNHVSHSTEIETPLADLDSKDVHATANIVKDEPDSSVDIVTDSAKNSELLKESTGAEHTDNTLHAKPLELVTPIEAKPADELLPKSPVTPIIKDSSIATEAPTAFTEDSEPKPETASTTDEVAVVAEKEGQASIDGLSKTLGDLSIEKVSDDTTENQDEESANEKTTEGSGVEELLPVPAKVVIPEPTPEVNEKPIEGSTEKHIEEPIDEEVKTADEKPVAKVVKALSGLSITDSSSDFSEKVGKKQHQVQDSHYITDESISTPIELPEERMEPKGSKETSSITESLGEPASNTASPEELISEPTVTAADLSEVTTTESIVPAEILTSTDSDAAVKPLDVSEACESESHSGAAEPAVHVHEQSTKEVATVATVADEPTEPVETAVISESIGSNESVEANESKITKSVEASEASELSETIEPVESIESVESAETIESVKPIDIYKSTELIDPAEPIESTEPVGTTVESAESVEPAKSIKTAKSTESITSAEPSEPTKHNGAIELTEPTRSTGENGDSVINSDSEPSKNLVDDLGHKALNDPEDSHETTTETPITSDLPETLDDSPLAVSDKNTTKDVTPAKLSEPESDSPDVSQERPELKEELTTAISTEEPVESTTSSTPSSSEIVETAFISPTIKSEKSHEILAEPNGATLEEDAKVADANEITDKSLKEKDSNSAGKSVSEEISLHSSEEKIEHSPEETSSSQSTKEISAPIAATDAKLKIAEPVTPALETDVASVKGKSVSTKNEAEAEAATKKDASAAPVAVAKKSSDSESEESSNDDSDGETEGSEDSDDSSDSDSDGSASSSEDDDDDEEEDEDEEEEEEQEQPEILLYTSFASSSVNMVSDTNRMAHILEGNKIKFTYVDVGTDEKAKRVWKWKSKGRKLPAVVREGEVVCDFRELEDINEVHEVWERLIEDEVWQILESIQQYVVQTLDSIV